MADSWDAPPSSATSARRIPPSRKAPAPVIRDDWDDEDEDDTPESSRIENSKQVWDSANTAAPMPQIVSALPSASVPATALLNQPTLKILKRPASSSPAPTVLPRALESLADKQARYENARQKIFGSDTTPSEASQTSSNTAQQSTPPVVRVTREPLGPGSPPPSASAAKGFTGRRTHRPDVSSPPS